MDNGCALGSYLGPIEQANRDIEADWSLHPGSNGDELITNQPFYHYNYRGNLKLVEPMGIAPTEILLAKQTPLLHSDHGPIVNLVANYTKLVDSAGLEPATR